MQAIIYIFNAIILLQEFKSDEVLLVEIDSVNLSNYSLVISAARPVLSLSTW
jgi:hypothetical protein